VTESHHDVDIALVAWAGAVYNTADGRRADAWSHSERVVVSMKRVHWLVGALAVTAFAGHGPDVARAALDSSVVWASTAPQGTQLEVVLTDYAFTPSEVVVLQGSPQIKLVNEGLRRHNLVILVDGKELESPGVRPGDSVEWEAVVERSGRYTFWCSEYRHLEKGMVGTLIVQ
jgi:plastocyanin